MKQVEPAALGLAFLSWCVRQGWLVQQGKEYLVNKEGVQQLAEKFDISL